MSIVPRSPGRGLENLQLRDRKIEDSRSSPLQEISRCYERFRCLWKSFCILWSVSETSDYTRKILFKIVTVDPPKPSETVTDRRSPTSNRSSWKWREVESDERELLPFIGLNRLLIDYLEYFSEICAHMYMYQSQRIFLFSMLISCYSILISIRKIIQYCLYHQSMVSKFAPLLLFYGIVFFNLNFLAKGLDLHYIFDLA